MMIRIDYAVTLSWAAASSSQEEKRNCERWVMDHRWLCVFFPELLVGETEIPQEVLCGVLLFSKNDARSQSLYLRILVVFLTLPLWLLGALEFCLGCRDVL